jgi:hypothetical protein
MVQSCEERTSAVCGSTKVVRIGGAFAKGHQGFGGRKRGTPNKFLAELKQIILQALDECGGVEYLKQRAVNNPTAFLTRIGKVLPLQVSAKNEGHFPVRWQE